MSVNLRGLYVLINEVKDVYSLDTVGLIKYTIVCCSRSPFCCCFSEKKNPRNKNLVKRQSIFLQRAEKVFSVLHIPGVSWAFFFYVCSFTLKFCALYSVEKAYNSILTLFQSEKLFHQNTQKHNAETHIVSGKI